MRTTRNVTFWRETGIYAAAGSGWGRKRGAVFWDLYIYRANKGLNGQNGENLWEGSRRFANEGKKCARGRVKTVCNKKKIKS